MPSALDSLRAARPQPAVMGRPAIPVERIAADVIVLVAERGPIVADDIRRLVHGQNRRVDAVVRQLAAEGRIRRVGRAGFVLSAPSSSPRGAA